MFVIYIFCYFSVCREDFTDCDCIAFFILTHGNNKQEIAAKDVYYSFDKFWEPFCADKCPTLAGKPKLYFISACRGKKKDSGKKIFSRGHIQSDSGSRSVGYKIPNNADFLMAHSTTEGTVYNKFGSTLNVLKVSNR